MEWAGVVQLLKFFSARFCFNEHIASYVVPKPNNFEHFVNYFIQKAIVRAVPLMRYDDGQIPAKIAYSTCWLLMTIQTTITLMSITWLRSWRLSCNPMPKKDPFEELKVYHVPLLQDMLSEIERLRLKDLMFPSHHNLLTVTALECLIKLQAVNLYPVDLDLLKAYCKQGHFIGVTLKDSHSSVTVNQRFLNSYSALSSMTQISKLLHTCSFK